MDFLDNPSRDEFAEGSGINRDIVKRPRLGRRIGFENDLEWLLACSSRNEVVASTTALESASAVIAHDLSVSYHHGFALLESVCYRKWAPTCILVRF